MFNHHGNRHAKPPWQPPCAPTAVRTNRRTYLLFTARPPAPADFASNYTAFVSRLVSKYEVSTNEPVAPKVLLVCGPMTNVQCPYVRDVVADLKRVGIAAAFANATLPNSPSRLNGCAGHPNATEALRVVDAIAAAFEDLTGWHGS